MKKPQHISILVLLFFLVVHTNLFSQQADERIKKVHLVFKTHLDIGFTELSSVVEQQYINEFIPKALDVIDQLRSEKAEESYVWTTGSWLISEYLQQATPEAVKRLETAILRGDIVWNGVPYTTGSELMSKDLFASCLNLSKQLDRRFGKKTIAAKMTDVPGHTRSIVTPLCDAGITFLHIGVNPASAVPCVPSICRWRNTDGKEIVLMYQGVYGEDMILPDGETVVSINFTNDNHGPHTMGQIKDIYAAARAKYPNASIAATSLNEIAKDMQTMVDKIPVFTSEIGDTWIYGYAGSPLRVTYYRALSRLYSQWINTGKLDMNSPVAINFAVKLGLIAEHTWGLDVKTFLKNWDKYDFDIFKESRNLPAFKLIEKSWAEQNVYINQAIALLPASLQKEARRELKDIGKAPSLKIKNNDSYPKLDEHGAYNMSVKNVDILAGKLTYQTYSSEDYTTYQNMYLREKPQWALGDFGKPGLENSNAKSATLVTNMTNCKVKKTGKGTVVQCNLQFPESKDVDPRVLPENTTIEYMIPTSGNSVEMKVSFRNKPANRLPEAYLLSFVPSGIEKILAEKTGCMVDVSDVVEGGNRQMHAIDNYIDIVTKKGTIRITSLDAPVVLIGQRKMLNYSKELPDLNDGVHFCLFNNLWGTNFTMWYEGNLSFRFKIEVVEQKQ